MSEFWQKGLRAWCWLVILLGLLLAGAGFAATDGPTRLLLGVMNPDASQAFDQTHRFAIALMGAVTLGWAATLLPGFAAIHRLGDPSGSWRAMTAAVVAWYVIDSSLSVAIGFWPNAVSNTLLLIGFLLPLWRSGVLSR